MKKIYSLERKHIIISYNFLKVKVRTIRDSFSEKGIKQITSKKENQNLCGHFAEK